MRLQRCAAVIMVLVCLAVAAGVQGEEADVKGIFYKVTKEGGAAYVLGSIHIGSQEMHPFGAALQAAMEEAETFVFECDNTSQEAVQAAVQCMYFTDKTRLYDVVSPECYARVQEVCKRKGYRSDAFDKHRPWAAMAALSLETTADMMGAANLAEAETLGVETVLEGYVKKRKAPVAYLETTQEQLDAFNQFSPALQEYMLEQALGVVLDPSTATGLDADMQLWPTWWRQGNSQAFVDSFLAGMQGEPNVAFVQEYNHGLITRRNRLMADRLDAMMREEPGRVLFVTVGLLHLVLPGDSVLEDLESRGYKVECLSGE